MTQRTIVVAGGASGIGLATAQRAVADGWRTIIVDIQDPLEPVAARLVKCDLLDADAARTALEGIVRDEERVDALVASAGGQMGGALAAYDVEEWTQRFTANTLPVLRSIRSLLPALQAAAAANGVADIIVVGSIAGDTAFDYATIYGAAAAGRDALGEQLRVELRTEQIRARTISMGFVLSPMTAGLDIPAVTDQMAEEPLLPEDIATIVHHGLNLPPDVNVHDIVVVPTSQEWA
ncbi:SDR family oxidoreductase [[Pseudopropionibacterium] massiliense]|uniref:SDR family oxidoreductase n=1 Tax=[Pseudopropionibacterium] massiliense TaxID=2220000 RepID=UPI00102F2E67|nr:SDR family NAD(P)-dependent oxidoreductase [[Pseudopropionibacterium] massiliense]